MAVTITSAVSQWAETQRKAVGAGRARPAAAQAWLNSLSSMAFMGIHGAAVSYEEDGHEGGSGHG